MATWQYELPDGTTLIAYEHGGIDVVLSNGNSFAIATTREACAELARIAQEVADSALSDDEVP